MAYEVHGSPSPLQVRANSTRSVASTRVLLSGASLQEVCDAAGWSSPHTFIRFYSLDLLVTPGLCRDSFTSGQALVSMVKWVFHSLKATSQVTYVTMVPWEGNETLPPLAILTACLGAACLSLSKADAVVMPTSLYSFRLHQHTSWCITNKDWNNCTRASDAVTLNA